ncbi:hypothetical protein ACFL7D_08790 [candidate division KSB1 bacterium]
MAKKQKTFAEKALGKKGTDQVCATCNELFSPIMIMRSEENKEGGNIKYVKTMVNVCKCNEKEVYS